MFQQLWSLLKPFRPSFLKLILLSSIYETVQIVMNYRLPAMIVLYEMKVPLEIWILAGAGLFVFNELFNRYDNYYDWHIVKQSHAVKNYLFVKAEEKFLNLSLAWHKEHNSGTLQSQVYDGMWKTSSLVDMASWEAVPTTIQFLLSLPAVIFLSGWLGGIATTAIMIFLYITGRSEKFKQPIRKVRQRFYETTSKNFSEAIQAIQTVYLFGQEEFELSRRKKNQTGEVTAAYDEHRKGIFHFNRWRSRNLMNFNQLILFVFLAMLNNGTLDIPNLFFLSTLVERLFSSVWRFSRLSDQANRDSEGMKCFLNLLSEPDYIDRGTESVDIVSAPEIRFNNVSFSYRGESVGEQTIKNISFTAKPGQMVAIVCPSGAGKSTIAALIAKLNDITGGEIYIAGLPISKWNGKLLRQHISFIPQDNFIFDDTLHANIAYGKPDATREEVVEAAKTACIHDFIMSTEKGYDTIAGERGVQLSGGQRQRIGIARALLPKSEILILDESTSHLDSETERIFQEYLTRMLKTKTIFVIAHRFSTIRKANWIVAMDNGRVVEQGTHRQLMKKRRGLYRRLVRHQTNA